MRDVLAEQKRYYAERAPEYDDWWYRRGRYTRDAEHERRWWHDVAELEERLRTFAPSGDVLELAAGTGIWTRRLVPTANRVVAVDANAETLALNTPAADLVVADIFSWRPPQEFDVVFFSFWLSHVPEERFTEFWALVRSALRPNGRVFLIDSGPPETADTGELPAGAPQAPRGVRPGAVGFAGGASSLQVRRLADGREFTIVKRFWQPNELAERVARLGFELDLALTGNGLFLHGGSA